MRAQITAFSRVFETLEELTDRLVTALPGHMLRDILTGLARPEVFPDGDLGMRKVIRDHDALPVLPVSAPVRPAAGDARPNRLDFLLRTSCLPPSS